MSLADSYTLSDVTLLFKTVISEILENLRDTFLCILIINSVLENIMQKSNYSLNINIFLNLEKRKTYA